MTAWRVKAGQPTRHGVTGIDRKSGHSQQNGKINMYNSVLFITYAVSRTRFALRLRFISRTRRTAHVCVFCCVDVALRSAPHSRCARLPLPLRLHLLGRAYHADVTLSPFSHAGKRVVHFAAVAWAMVRTFAACAAPLRGVFAYRRQLHLAAVKTVSAGLLVTSATSCSWLFAHFAP